MLSPVVPVVPCQAQTSLVGCRKDCVRRASSRVGHEGGVEGFGAASVVSRMHSQLRAPTVHEGFQGITVCRSDADIDAALRHCQQWDASGACGPQAGSMKELADAGDGSIPQAAVALTFASLAACRGFHNPFPRSSRAPCVVMVPLSTGQPQHPSVAVTLVTLAAVRAYHATLRAYCASFGAYRATVGSHCASIRAWAHPLEPGWHGWH